MIISRSGYWPRKQIFLASADALFAALAMFAAVMIRLGFEEGGLYLTNHWTSVTVAWGLYIVSFYVCGLYELDAIHNVLRMLGSAFFAVLLGSVLTTSVFYATFSLQMGRGIFLGFAALVYLAVVANRLFYVAAYRRGLMEQRCLIIGTNGEVHQIVELIRRNNPYGFRVLGLIHCGPGDEKIGRFIDDLPVIGTLDSLEQFVDLYDIERLILATTPDEENILLKRLRSFRYRGLAIVDFVTLYEELAQEIPIDHINDEWLFYASMNSSLIHIRRFKRLTDVVVSLAGLLLAAPLMGIVAALIKLTSRGPVFYKQERLGRDSQPFELLKFRTMVADAESRTGPVWAAENDPRITPLGKWLRKTRIDELPQLINVLRGDMSLVGPRPEREVFIRRLSEDIPYYAERLLVPPGITGWAQVMAPYAASVEDSRRKLQFDLYYIKHMSFMLDFFIFMKTFKTMLFGRERHPKTKKEREAARRGEASSEAASPPRPAPDVALVAPEKKQSA